MKRQNDIISNPVRLNDYELSTHLEAAPQGPDPCQQVLVLVPASEGESSSFPPAPSGSYRSSLPAGDSTRPVEVRVKQIKELNGLKNEN